VLGHEEPYDRLPYFFTDQYDLGMEYVGYVPRGADVRVVTRGDVPGREFVAFWVDRDDRLLASMNVNVWDVVDAVRPAIGHRVDAARLADPGVPYAELAGSS
jgi:3-phenylpropionate/trans-cinnamate dioxygenase ferredoxin reductase subunit